MTKRRVLLATLGLGPENAPPPHYASVRYKLDDGRTTDEATPLVQQALAELLGPFDDIVLFATKDVLARWRDTGLIQQCLASPHRFVEVPDGGTSSEIRDFFEKVRVELDAQHTADELVVDVTHGFRVQPTVLLAALSFVLSDWRRRGLPKGPTLTVTYGAYDRRRDGPAPIWDLTEVVLAQRWNSAIDALLRFGRADDLQALLDEEHRRVAPKESSPEVKARAGRLKDLGTQARAFADDLALGRLQALTATSARNLLRTLESEQGKTWLATLPWLDSAARTLVEELRPLGSDTLMTAEGVRASLAVARFYLRTERFAELAATLRETLVTKLALDQGISPGSEPGRGAWDTAAREAAERAATSRDRATPAGKVVHEIHSKLRNDVEHLGLNGSPGAARDLRSALAKGIEAVELADGKLPPGPAPMLWNFSNHPVDTWSESQRSAARALGHGEPTDLPEPMPIVDPEASEQDVAKKAKELAAAAQKAGVTGAVVMGEQTLTYALVSALRASGVVCYAATTQRAVQTETLHDDAVTKTSVFVFRAWRRYG